MGWIRVCLAVARACAVLATLLLAAGPSQPVQAAATDGLEKVPKIWFGNNT